jgi:integrase
MTDLGETRERARQPPSGTHGPNFRDDEGRVVDFHALRTSLSSHLAAEGVPLTTVKTIMRHSTIELTAKHSTRVSDTDVRPALAKLRSSSSEGPAMVETAPASSTTTPTSALVNGS